MSRAVLDASAILAFLRGEPGADVVADYRGDALASSVNIAEAATRLAHLGASPIEVRRAIALMAVDVVPFDTVQAYAAAGLYETTRDRGLSLGDRACLQLAARSGLPALTADRVWAEVDVPAEVRLIRD